MLAINQRLAQIPVWFTTSGVEPCPFPSLRDGGPLGAGGFRLRQRPTGFLWKPGMGKPQVRIVNQLGNCSNPLLIDRGQPDDLPFWLGGPLETEILPEDTKPSGGSQATGFPPKTRGNEDQSLNFLSRSGRLRRTTLAMPRSWHREVSMTLTAALRSAPVRSADTT